MGERTMNKTSELKAATGEPVPAVALSICQPWAWAIARGFKTVENRTWKTAHRGPIAIHASSSDRHMTLEAEDILIDGGEHIFDALNSYGDENGFTEDNPPFQFGVIVGTVEIVGCLEVEPGAVDFAEQVEAAGLAEWAEVQTPDPFHWAEGPYCWCLANAIILPKPIPATGKLNLWGLDSQQRRALAKELARRPRVLPNEFRRAELAAAAGLKGKGKASTNGKQRR